MDDEGGERRRADDGFAVIEPWAEVVDGRALLDELEGMLRRFVVLPKWAAETLALFTVHTYRCCWTFLRCSR